MSERGEAPVLIMAGGTGGHVFPALAVAEALRARAVPVHWLGTDAGIEARLVPATGIALHCLSVSGLRGKGLLARVRALLSAATAVAGSMRLIRRLRPRCVLGMGGYVAAPGGVAAWLLRVPLVIHEQNAVPGTTNRLLAHFARFVLSGFPTALGGARNRYIGNPVRAAIAALPAPEARWRDRSGPLRLLVLGGSQGARAINDCVPAALAQLAPEQRPEIWHQTGARHAEDVAEAYRESGVQAHSEPFIDDMAAAYGWADVVLCRAGALTVAELAAAGVGALLVPLPQAIDDHQRANARWLAQGGGGEILEQQALTAQQLARRLGELVQTGRDSLLRWALAARDLARIDAAERAADACLEVQRG